VPNKFRVSCINWFSTGSGAYDEDNTSMRCDILLRNETTNYVYAADSGDLAGKEVILIWGRCTHRKLKTCKNITIQNYKRKNIKNRD